MRAIGFFFFFFSANGMVDARFDSIKHFSACAYLACQGHCAGVDGLGDRNGHSGETVILALHNVSICQARQGLPTRSYSVSRQTLRQS